MAKLALLALLLVAGCHHYGRATPATCHAKYIEDAWRPSKAKYDRCMDSYYSYVEHGGEEGLRQRRAAAWGTVAKVAVAAAYVHAARNGDLYRCQRWSDNTVTCVRSY